MSTCVSRQQLWEVPAGTEIEVVNTNGDVCNARIKLLSSQPCYDTKFAAKLAEPLINYDPVKDSIKMVDDFEAQGAISGDDAFHMRQRILRENTNPTALPQTEEGMEESKQEEQTPAKRSRGGDNAPTAGTGDEGAEIDDMEL